MGHYSSRIIWGKFKTEGEERLEPVTDVKKDVIYTSGNIVIFVNVSVTGIYKCKVEESCNTTPSTHPEDWEELPSWPVAKIMEYMPGGAPSKVVEMYNSSRQQYNPGARIIVYDVKDGCNYAYMCTESTNLYYDGFVPQKWGKIYQTVSIEYKPRDHKEVYYDDGRNTVKWHKAMYYMPEDPWDAEEEITFFNENTSYLKGERVLYRHYGDNDVVDIYGNCTYHAQWTKVFEYTGNIPSQPTRYNDQGEIEYQQPSPHHTATWDPVDDIPIFDTGTSYQKGDMVVYNQYNDSTDEQGEIVEYNNGWYIYPISVFDPELMYNRGQRCLYRIKPYESDPISEKDCLKLKETGDYDMLPIDEYNPILKPQPTSDYGNLIESGQEIYGLYEYIGSDYKPEGYEFNNKGWQLIPEVKMFDKDIDKYNAGYLAGEYVIAPYRGTYAVYKAMRDKEPDYYIPYEHYYDWGEDAMRYGYFIGQLYMTTFWIGFSANPQDTETDDRVTALWQLVTQKIKEPVVGYRVYKAVKDIRYGFDFIRTDWTIVTQIKKQYDTLYGYIWKKLDIEGGGTPFGADFPIPSIMDHNKNRFNGLSIYRGNNELTLGEVVTHSDTSNGENYYCKLTGLTGWYYNEQPYGTFFIREKFKRNWYSLSLYKIIRDSGIQVRNLFNREFWSNGIISFASYYANTSCNFYKVTITDYANRIYGVVNTASYERNVDLYYNNNYSILHNYTESFLLPGYGGVQTGPADPNFGWVYFPFKYSSIAESLYYGLITGPSEVNAYYNQDGEVIKTNFLTGSLIWYDALNRPEFFRIAYANDLCSPYDTFIRYFMQDLTYFPQDGEEEASFSTFYCIFDDGWEGDLDHSNTLAWYRHWLISYSMALRHAGVTTISTDEQEYYRSGEMYGHTYSKEVEVRMNYEKPQQPYICLFNKFNEIYRDSYNFRVQGDHYEWISHDPRFCIFSFFSEDKTMFYQLKCCYGYFAKKLYYDETHPENIGYYTLAILDKTPCSGGATMSGSLFKNNERWHEDVGYYDSSENVWYNHDIMCDKVLTTGYALWPHMTGHQEYELNVVYHTPYYLYIINSTWGPADAGGYNISKSTGLWEISYRTYTDGSSLISRNNAFLYPLTAYNDPIQALVGLCIIQKIPYYGYNTCQLNYMGRQFKYLNLNIGGLYLERGVCEYIDSKLDEWEDEDCLMVDIKMYEHQDSPICANSTSGLVYNADDIIITKKITISNDTNTMNQKYVLCVVLPHFKSIFENSIANLRWGRGCYDPVATGAFFWLTSDSPLYNVDPQYGGPEGTAQGFRGW